MTKYRLLAKLAVSLLLVMGIGAFIFPGPAALAADSGGVTENGTVKSYAGMTISREVIGENNFTGSKECASCHEIEYNAWKKTFHSTVIRDARKYPSAVLADFSTGDLPFSREEVEYTIGSHWDQRYMKRIGDEYYVLPRLWSVQSKEWRPYSVWSWKKKPYSRYCAGCHTTNYDPVKRTIAEEGIGCESCHGPGGLHVRGEGDPSKIVDPGELTSERSNMICASCHVRGKDISGEYYFPVKYLPGDDLAETYIPLEKREDESVSESINRLFGKWKAEMQSASRSKCEVCGIAGRVGDSGQTKSDMGFCFSCHNFKAKVQLHTRHPDTVELACSSCHVKRAEDISEGLTGNIHFSSFFLIHTENCYDPDIAKACAVCHTSEKDPGSWAREKIRSWKKPVIVDH